jgi:hypothetical protein
MPRDRRDFDFRAPDYEDAVERAETRSMFDNILKDAKPLKPAVGANTVRILPALGWNPPKRYYGLSILSHNNIGPGRGRQYLCLNHPLSPHKYCPICDYLGDRSNRVTQEEAQKMGVREQVMFYVINRAAESEGVMPWTVSNNAAAEISSQSVNRRTKSVLNIIHPDSGFDIDFLRIGTGLNTKYRGYQVARDESPIHDDLNKQNEWLDFVEDHPLPSILQFYSPEHIDKVMRGKASPNVYDEEPDREADEAREARRSSRGSSRDERSSREEPRDEGRSRTRDRDGDDRDTRSERTRDPEPEPERERGRDEGRGRERAERVRDPEPEPEAPRDRGEREERPRERTRTRERSETAEAIDDDIPFEGGARTTRRERVRDDDDTPPPRDEGQRGRREGRSSRDDRDDDRQAETVADGGDQRSRRDGLRERLNRDRDRD